MDDIDIDDVAAKYDRLPSVDTLRKYQLEQYLHERPYLNDDEERRAVWLSGAFIGALSHYQRSELGLGEGSAFDDRFDADQMTPADAELLLPEVFSKAEAYAKNDEYAEDSVFPEFACELSAALTSSAPEMWSLPKSRLRFLYAVGVSHGHNVQQKAWDLRDKLKPYFDTEGESDTEQSTATQTTD